MFRKTIGLVLCLALCASSAWAGQTRASAPDFSGDLATLFPADTLFYAEIGDVPNAIDNLGGVETLYRAIETAYHANSVANTKLPMTLEQFRAMLGSSIAVGVMYPAPSGVAPSMKDFENVSVAAIARVPSPEGLAMLKMLIELGKPKAPAPRAQTVHGFDLTVVPGSKPQNTMSYGFSGDTLLFGQLVAVTRVLDTVASPTAKRLAGVAGYQSASQRVAGHHQFFAFLNGPPVVTAVNAGIDAGFKPGMFGGQKPSAQAIAKAQRQATAIKSFLGLDAMQALAVSVQVDSRIVRVQTAMEIDRTKDGLVNAITDPPTISVRASSFLPADTDVMSAGSYDYARIYDLAVKYLIPLVAEETKKPSGPAKTPADVIREADTAVGMSVRNELIPALGSEFAIGLNVGAIANEVKKEMEPAEPEKMAMRFAEPSQDGNQMQVEPDAKPDVKKDEAEGGVLLVEVKDPEVVSRAVDTMFTQGNPSEKGKSPRTTVHNGVQVLHRGDFGWAFVDGFAILGIKDKDIERAIDAHATNQSLATSPNFVAIGATPDQTISALFLAPRVFQTAANAASKITVFGQDDVNVDSPLANGLYIAARKDATGVYNQFEIQIGDAWKKFVDSLVREIGEGAVKSYETDAHSRMRSLSSAEATYQSNHERFGTLDQLKNDGLLDLGFGTDGRYTTVVTVGADGKTFAATSTPITYGKTGFRSFFLDESMVVRAADHKGVPATASDPVVE